MWIWIANKFAQFHAKRLNRSENIPKFQGATFLKHPVHNRKQSELDCAQRTQTSTKPTISTKVIRDSTPDFRINPDSYPNVFRIAPKWIYYLSASDISPNVVKVGRWLYEKC